MKRGLVCCTAGVSRGYIPAQLGFGAWLSLTLVNSRIALTFARLVMGDGFVVRRECRLNELELA